MIFEAPILLALAPVVALLVGALVWLARRRRVRLAAAWSPVVARAARARGRWAPLVFGALALLAGVALAGPRGGRTQVRTRSQALSMVMAIDISRSMLAEDVKPNRLRRAVREARRLLEDSPGDRAGLIAFAGRSYILAPLTVDGGAIRLNLDALDPDLASEGGTSLASVLAQGTDLLRVSGEVSDRVLVIFTDGETHDTMPEALAAAKAAKAAGVRIVLVAEGGTTPVRIPIRDSTGALVEYKRDELGGIVQTARRDDVLSALADAGDATLVAADVPDQAGAIRALLTTFKRSPSAESQITDLVPRAWIPLLGAVVLLLLYTLTRRGTALLALAGLAFLPPLAHAQRPTPGERAQARGGPAEAASAYLNEARSGAARDTAFYNAGTAALNAGRLDIARGALVEAAKSLDPELRYRALYNLGLTGILAARSDSAHREQLLGEASDHLRDALMLRPASERAKWNLELAERRRRRGRRGQGTATTACRGTGQGAHAQPGRADSEFNGAAGARYAHGATASFRRVGWGR
ncbi:MAG: VWA domain-containing protein [Gemmatimonadota bacterium]